MTTRKNTTLEIFSRLVNPRYFVEATRESGYKGTPHALAELVDNSLQAKASAVHIHFEERDSKQDDVWVYVLDNGTGMSADVLALAPQFGGTTRFNDRSGMGRFGMGLPNASVSQCRRLEMYSKRDGGELLYCYLDLDEIEDEKVQDGFINPMPIDFWPVPDALKSYLSETGTLVIWKKCDRLEPKNLDGLRKTVTGFMGQAFRNFVYPAVGAEGRPARLIAVNGQEVKPFDPLFLDARCELHGSEERGISRIEIPVPGKKGEMSTVQIKYSILPIEQWAHTGQKELAEKRVTANKGFSIVRSGREIEVTDRYFLPSRGSGGKEGSIQHYDAWWACEISFGPELDDAFGVTHTKQEIRPKRSLLDRILPEVSATISTLRKEIKPRINKRTVNMSNPSEEIATRNDVFLPPAPEIEQDPKEYAANLTEYLEKTNREGESKEKAQERVQSKLFTLEFESGKEGPFYRTSYLGDATIVYVNTDHPFYMDVFSMLDDNPEAQKAVQLLLFALAKGERLAASEEGRKWYMSQRTAWSAALYAYLGK